MCYDIFNKMMQEQGKMQTTDKMKMQGGQRACKRLSKINNIL